MLLVLMDNATAEYTFVSTFFNHAPRDPPASDTAGLLVSPTQTSTIIGDRKPSAGDDVFLGHQRRHSAMSNLTPGPTANERFDSKEHQKATAALWKQVMDPTLTYCQVR